MPLEVRFPGMRELEASDLIWGIATECGVDFNEISNFCWAIPCDPEAMFIDHINYAVTDVDGDHTLIAGDDLIQSDVILGYKKIERTLKEKLRFIPSEALAVTSDPTAMDATSAGN
ncbi:hypothetical protein EJB05_13506, partial [Eragrostis curvula]